MDAKPSRDHLTLRPSPPQFRSNDDAHLAFAIICSPVTYGLPLYSEMKAKGQALEYLVVRNAAILRREFMRMDFLNPVISERCEYLKVIKTTLTSLDNNISVMRITLGFIKMLQQQSDKYHELLSSRVVTLTSTSEYQDKFGARLSYLLAFKSSSTKHHQMLSEYGTLLKDIAALIPKRHSILKFLLLNRGFHSYIVNLSNDDRQTKFFVTLTARERAIISSRLTDLGEDDRCGAIPPTLEEVIRHHWPSSITINREYGDDYFCRDQISEYNEFVVLKLANEQTQPTLDQPTSSTSNNLMNLLTKTSIIEDTPTTRTQTPPAPPSTAYVPPNLRQAPNTTNQIDSNAFKMHAEPSNTVGMWRPKFVPNRAIESSKPLANPQSESSVKSRQPSPDHLLDDTESRPMTLPTPQKAQKSTHDTPRRIRFSDANNELTIHRTGASASPDRHPPGDVVRVALHANDQTSQGNFEIYIKRFTIHPNGSIDLYLTKQGRFSLLLTRHEHVDWLECEITCGGTKESKEFRKETSDLWFVTFMD